MKLPFASILGPPLKRYSKFYNRVCTPRVFGCDAFVICMGILGIFVTIMDICRIIQGGSTLSENLWRSKCSRGNRAVSAEVERDLKLMASIMAVEHYTLLVFGAITQHPALLLPWLGLEMLVITLEGMLFFAKAIVEGIHMKRGQIIVNAIMIHNWLQVFCLFKTLIGKCDI